MSLAEQMGNIGSEISRARSWRGRDPARSAAAVDRALELLDLTIADPRWRAARRLKEIARAREVVCDAFLGDGAYGRDFESLQRYFDVFALAARARR